LNRKKLYGLLDIAIVVATMGSIAAFGEKFFGIYPKSGISKERGHANLSKVHL
jgi:hypothetical protein